MSFVIPLRPHLKNLRKLDYLKHDDSTLPPDIVDCSFGVSPFGCSCNIDKKSLAADLNFEYYGPLPFDETKDRIIDYWREVISLGRHNLTVTSGTMTIINLFNVLVIESGVKVLGYAPQFAEFANSVRARGGFYEYVPLRPEENFKFRPEDMLDKINLAAKNGQKYTIVYIDNPNNPTGQIIPVNILEPIIRKAGESGSVVIVDEAYGDFMPKENSAISLVGRHENLMVLRSFSKGYALAGLRVGYFAASQLLVDCYSLVDDFLVNTVGLKAAAISLADSRHLPETILRTIEVKSQIMAACKKMRIMATDKAVPIFTLMHPDKHVNLRDLLLSHRCLTSSGFDNLGRNAVRLRIPKKADQVIEIIKKIEKSIS